MTEAPDTKPGDMLGKDSHSKWHVSRSIPLPWLMAMVMAIIGGYITVVMGQRTNGQSIDTLIGDVSDVGKRIDNLSTRIIALSDETIRAQGRIEALRDRAAAAEARITAIEADARRLGNYPVNGKPGAMK